MDLLSRERTIAGPGFNRWLVPPAALAIHLSIGMAYGLSVFWKPLSQMIGITQSAPDDWKISTVSLTFSIAIFFLGSSAAVFGRWLERVGPRKAGVAAACCWGGGFLIAALGAHSHQIWLIWLGLGVIGGCGLGPWLHLARLHPHQVVPRPPGPRDRHGDHGLRRWRDDRRAAG